MVSEYSMKKQTKKTNKLYQCFYLIPATVLEIKLVLTDILKTLLYVKN